jgi:hypothetical protein
MPAGDVSRRTIEARDWLVALLGVSATTYVSVYPDAASMVGTASVHEAVSHEPAGHGHEQRAGR